MIPCAFCDSFFPVPEREWGDEGGDLKWSVDAEAN